MQYEHGSPDAFAQAMLDRAQDPTMAGKPKGVPLEFIAAALVAIVLGAIAFVIAT